jgi:hypothetical protein
MEFVKIKELNFTFDRDFNYELKSDNPNYIHYNGYLDLISVDVLLDILDKTFQGIKYEISLKSSTFSYLNYNLNILGFDITIQISDKVIYFRDINNRIFFTLSKNQKFSNVNILKDILDNLKVSKSKKYFINMINSIPEFEYKWDYGNPNILEIYYRKLNINFIVDISTGKIEYISYLFHEGETYYYGDEKLTTDIIKSRIEYYNSLLSGEFDIKEILKSLG